MTMKKKLAPLILLFLFGIGGCVNQSIEAKRNVVEQTFQNSNFTHIYHNNSWFSVLPIEERKKVVKRYESAVVDFFAENLTLQEIRSYSEFQEDPDVNALRKYLFSSSEPPKNIVENFLEKLDDYPVLKKIASDDFQDRLTDYVIEKLSQKQ